MSITALAGLPGSGKSHSATEIMRTAIKEGRDVYTNIPLHTDVWMAEFKACPVVFDIQDIIDNPKWFEEVFPSGATLCLDEVWRLWPAGLKANAVRVGDKEFLAMHRHKVNEAGQTSEIYLCTQDLAQLSAFVRQLVDKTYRCTKLDAVGQDKRYRVDIYQGAVTGQNPPPSQRLREMFYKYDPEIFKLYKSATLSKAGDAGNEAKADKRANIMKGGKVKAIIAGLIILPIIAGFAIWRTAKGVKKMTGEQAPITTQANGAQLDPRAAVELARVRAEQATSLLHGRKITISAVANYGNGNEYRFKVKDGDGVARFNQMELIHAGYRVEPQSECMVKISGYSEVIFAMCVEDQSAGVVAQAFQPAKDDKSSL